MRLEDLTLAEQLVLALSLILLCMLIVDPLMLEQAKALPQGVRKFFRTITDIGKSNWMLIPTGTAVALALVLRQRYGGWRNAAAYGLIASTIGFVFVSIGGAKLIANLTKTFSAARARNCSRRPGRSTSIFSRSTRITPRCRPATPPISLALPP